MRRSHALKFFDLSSEASLADAKMARLAALNAAKNDDERTDIKEAFEVIRATQEAVEKKMSEAAHPPMDGNDIMLRLTRPPYEETLIRERIEALPKRVRLKCNVTGEWYSCELSFNLEYNSYGLRHPLPANDEPTIEDVTLPVIQNDFGASVEIAVNNDTFGSVLEKVRKSEFKFFRQRSDSYKIAELHKSYSRPTYLHTIDGNDASFGHSAMCCHCGVDHHQTCEVCDLPTCHSVYVRPAQWKHDKDQKLACPYCKKRSVVYWGKKAMERFKVEAAVAVSNFVAKDNESDTTMIAIRKALLRPRIENHVILLTAAVGE